MSTSAKVLIVDDEEVVRLSYTRVLASARCRVESASTWQQLAWALEQGEFDVVLLDMRMPDMDGVAVLEAVKQRWPASEVIIITGYPTLESAKRAVALGAYDYLMKPLAPDQVVEAANAALLHKRWAMHTDEDTAAAPTAALPQAISPAVPAGLRTSPNFQGTYHECAS